VPLSPSFSLRRVGYSDCEALWAWANEPEVRAASFNSAPIPLSGHRRWFARRLNSSVCDILIATARDGHRVGVIRFDADKRSCLTVSITVSADHRNEGYGSNIIRRACARLRTRRHVRNFFADIKLDNVASQVVFRRAGFRKLRTFRKNGVTAVRMVSA
jgi:UDP-2,4-diacetamido-2,4,6-trideoxy-beta-L-altropyranose hydrolase